MSEKSESGVPSLWEAEVTVAKALKPELLAHGILTMRAFNLMAAALRSLPAVRISEVPQAVKVAVSLSIRLQNDLRAAFLLAVNGYPTQAATIVASIYETAFTIAFIGNSEDRAQEWIDHDDPTRTFRTVRDLTREGVCADNKDQIESMVAAQYKVYSQLCMVRHSNPMYQMQHGMHRTSDGVESINGPDASPNAIRVAWFCLEHGIRLCMIALASFANSFLPLEERTSLKKEYDEIAQTCSELAEKASARFGTKDPSPGKWMA